MNKCKKQLKMLINRLRKLPSGRLSLLVQEHQAYPKNTGHFWGETKETEIYKKIWQDRENIKKKEFTWL